MIKYENLKENIAKVISEILQGFKMTQMQYRLRKFLPQTLKWIHSANFSHHCLVLRIRHLFHRLFDIYVVLPIVVLVPFVLALGLSFFPIETLVLAFPVQAKMRRMRLAGISQGLGARLYPLSLDFLATGHTFRLLATR